METLRVTAPEDSGCVTGKRVSRHFAEQDTGAALIANKCRGCSEGLICLFDATAALTDLPAPQFFHL